MEILTHHGDIFISEDGKAVDPLNDPNETPFIQYKNIPHNP